MERYQKEFIKFTISAQVLRFGKFTLKSGRISPYFFNSGLFNDGEGLARLGKFYAAAVIHAGIDFDIVYGPAYKGIPLAASMAIAFAEEHNKNYPFVFNRKEMKNHGEGGITFGAEISGNKVLIIDDVISAGTSLHESIDIIGKHGGSIAGAVVAVNRQERGAGETSAIHEMEQQHGILVASIISLDQIITYLREHGEMHEHLDAINTYKARYGVVDA